MSTELTLIAGLIGFLIGGSITHKNFKPDEDEK